MFKVNDYVVYGRSGVCRIDAIENDNGRDFYSMWSLHQKCQIRTPVNGPMPIRPVITANEANALIDRIPSIKAAPINMKNTTELTRKYRAFISAQDCLALIELTMSIYAKKQAMLTDKKKLSTTDQAFMKEGEELLFGEFSVALGIPVDQVQTYIKMRVKPREKTT